MKYIVIIGATSLIAEHCARIWVQREPIHLTLVGRSPSKLNALKNDLSIRSPRSLIECEIINFLDPNAIQTLVARLCTQQPIDIVLIAQGVLPSQHECQHNLLTCHEALNINALSPVLFAEAFASSMEEKQHGQIALISSVAGDRSRRSNYTYGAAKALCTAYAEGLQHRFSGTRVAITIIKPGPTNTPMTANFTRMTLAPVEQVSKQIVHGISKRKQIIYTPKKWAWIMRLVRRLPRFVFNQLNL